MGRNAQSGRRDRGLARPAAVGTGLAVVAAAAVAATVVPGHLGGGPHGTVLADPVATTVEHADGTVAAGRDGQRLVRGDVVRTGPAGRATVVAGSRQVRLLPSTSLALASRDSEQLRAGTVLVDDRGAPALHLQAAELAVTARSGAVVRVERGFTVRVGALAGDADVRNAVGRALRVGWLHQLRSDGRVLPPDGATPLALVDDAAERATGLPVVLDDVLLRRWLAGATATPADRTGLVASLASFHPAAAPACGSADDPGERLLPLAVARASRRTGTVEQRYGEAICYRAGGGSWGVVARLMQTSALRTLAQVHVLEAAAARGTAGGAVAAAAPPPGGVPLAAGPAAPANDAPQPPGPRPTPGTGGTPRPSPQPPAGSPAPSPPSAPAPSPSPSDLIGQVAGIIPSPPSLPRLLGLPLTVGTP